MSKRAAMTLGWLKVQQMPQKHEEETFIQWRSRYNLATSQNNNKVSQNHPKKYANKVIEERLKKRSNMTS